MTTPAPSLEDLPPERGTILELHSIGHEAFDGKLVEFHGIAKATRKYIVVSFDGKEQRMAVKPRVCKRPDIKPRELRQLLYDLVDEMKRSDPIQQEESRAKELLKKDPCSIPLHFLLGTIANRSELIDEETNEPDAAESMPHFYRANANLYAYEDILTNEEVSDMKAMFLATLAVAGRYKTIARIKTKSETLFNTNSIPANEEYFMMKSLMVNAQRHRKNNHINKEIKAYLQAASHGFKALRWSEKDEGKGMLQDLNAHIKHICEFFLELKRKTLLALHANASHDEWDRLEEELAQIQNYILHICSGVLGSCSREDGTYKLLTERQVTWLSTLKGKILDELKESADRAGARDGGNPRA